MIIIEVIGILALAGTHYLAFKFGYNAGHEISKENTIRIVKDLIKTDANFKKALMIELENEEDNSK